MAFPSGNPSLTALDATESRYTHRRGILLQLDPLEFGNLPDVLRPNYAGLTSSSEPSHFHVDQTDPFFSVPTLQARLYERGVERMRPINGQLVPATRPDLGVPILEWDCRQEANGRTIEDFAHVPGLQRVSSALDDGIGPRLQSPIGVGTSTQDQEIRNEPSIEVEAHGQSACDVVSTNAFRAVTVDDEEERQRILGTMTDADFPEIPDIVLRSYNSFDNLGDHSQLARNDLLLGNAQPDPVWDIQTKTRSERGILMAGFGTAVQHDSQDAHGIDLEADLLRSRSITPDILRELGYMPISSFNAFMDGDDLNPANEDNIAGPETCVSPNLGESELNVLEGNHLVEGYLAHGNSNARENAYDEFHGVGQIDSGEMRGDASRLHESSATGPQTGVQTVRNEREDDLLALELTERPVSETLLSYDPFGEHEDERIEESSMNDHSYISGSLSNGPGACEDISQANASDEDMTPNEAALCDLSNNQEGCQQQEEGEDSSSGGVAYRSAFLKEICRNMSAFSKRVVKQGKSRDARGENLKYYSLKRMEKDLSDNLDISQKLVVAVSQLCEERRRLEQACEKEREQVRGLRQILGV